MSANNGLAALEKKVTEVLIAASEDYVDFFEEQRKHYGHHCLGGLRKVSRHSHRVYRHLGNGDLTEAQIEFSYCQEQYDELLEHLKVVPGIVAREIENDAGQEVVEASHGIDFYPVLIGEKDISEVKLRTDEDLKVTPQAWLSGTADFASEIGKLAQHISGRLIRRGRIKISDSELHDRVLAIVDGVQKYFDRYDGSYPKIMNASNRRFQGYHSKERLVGNAGLWAIKSLNMVPVGAEEATEEE